MKQFSDIKIDGIQHLVKSTLDYLQGEDIAKHDIDYQLSSVEISIVLVLADIVELLPPPLCENVKQLLNMRERLWRERYFSINRKCKREERNNETI